MCKDEGSLTCQKGRSQADLKHGRSIKIVGARARARARVRASRAEGCWYRNCLGRIFHIFWSVTLRTKEDCRRRRSVNRGLSPHLRKGTSDNATCTTTGWSEACSFAIGYHRPLLQRWLCGNKLRAATIPCWISAVPGLSCLPTTLSHCHRNAGYAWRRDGTCYRSHAAEWWLHATGRIRAARGGSTSDDWSATCLWPADSWNDFSWISTRVRAANAGPISSALLLAVRLPNTRVLAG